MTLLPRLARPLAAVLVLGACSSDDDGPAPGATPADAGPAEAAPPDAAKDAAGTPDASGPAEAGGPEGGAPEAAPPDASTAPFPATLSQTGLFSDLATETLAPGVREFQPRYALWSDGATKRRWIQLPDGAQIDTSDMDFWTYPIGTKAWKEFTRDGKRIETRMLHKRGPSPAEWVMIAYEWRDDGTDADAVPGGVHQAKQTGHDIPSASDCNVCHGNMKDVLAGVSAIQLSHDLGGLTLTDLVQEGRLSAPPSGTFAIPGGSVPSAALGYLHANCGICHNDASILGITIPLRLWESTAALDTVENTLGYRTTVLQSNNVLPDLHVIEPGFPGRSELVIRMSNRTTLQMPPLATRLVDPDGLAAVEAWVSSLPPAPDAGADAGPADASAGDASTPDASAGDASAPDARPQDAAVGG